MELHPFIFDLQTTGRGAGKRDLPEHAELALENLHENYIILCHYPLVTKRSSKLFQDS